MPVTDAPIPFQVTRELLLDIYQAAREAFPAECCGWLAGPADGDEVTAARRCVNAQDSGTHPTVAGRGAETAYVFTGADLLDLNHSLDSELPARIIYHSHPNGQAYFSPTDREVATSPWGDGPAYPVQQLVVGIDGQRVVEAALFAWSDDAGGFVEIARYAGEDL
ncbi:MAG: Mov34/MPN/PAD-1 family protein [Chloroflexi bacterium]|nr:Mov34/MPN/PAD-1 family protein [Chloroflexota bacterium]MCI0786712.1 Mov34/MPN/PAD-1 family protein [Chloroflexota bacterium]MCI0794102.1 Mov34/MPN/PAD-1 family protein [Chloroflexota bacterium]MCI0857515.1 Mov34/MPN/PAD-1 family protein [Chloroflexota bacterium]